MRACHSCMRPIAACWRADGAGLRDAERHMVGVWRLARQFWKALNKGFQESIGSWGPRANPASKEKVPCALIPSLGSSPATAWDLLGRLIAAGDRGAGTAEQQHRLRHGSGTASDQMAPRPRMIPRIAQAFILALLLSLSEVAFHTSRVAVWAWQPGFQPVVPRSAGFASASQSTWPAASSSVISEDSNQSGLALPDLERDGCVERQQRSRRRRWRRQRSR